MSENSIKFSLSNSEQRDSWLNSGYQTLDTDMESSLMLTTVEYFLYFPLCFSIDNYGQWMVLCFTSCNWVVWSRSELYYIEHWMKLLYPV